MKFIIASNNRHKVAELKKILESYGMEALSLNEAGVRTEPEETGAAFEENARIKALAALEASGMPAVADDSGLAVDALGGAPGVYSARYGGPGKTDRERYELLLREMDGQEDRRCRFVCALCCVFPNGDELTARGECPGMLLRAPRGEGGFGYDPIFFLPERGKSMAELTAEEKNRVSHRARAMAIFTEELRNYYAHK